MSENKGNSGAFGQNDQLQGKDEIKENKGLQYLKTLISSSTSTLTRRDRIKDNPGPSTGENQEHIMDLLDLELELNNIQQGINQIDRITPSDPFGPSVSTKTASASDPFGDSFNPVNRKGKLPPPPDRGKRTTHKTSEKHWFDHETEALFEETELPNTLASLQGASPVTTSQSSFPLQSFSTSPLPTAEGNSEETNGRKAERDQFDVFTDLDPLGTGRSKPYIDKKDFFQDLKNPPKKVLKDLVTEGVPDSKLLLFSGRKESEKGSNGASDEQDASFPTASSVQTSQLFSDAFQDDPFDKDPFSEVDFSQTVFTPNNDPFEKFADFASFKNSGKSEFSDKYQLPSEENETKPTPLKVSLPPEKLGSVSYDSSTLSPSLSRRNRLQKANSVSSVLKPPSPKQRSRHRTNQVSESFADRSSPITDTLTLRSRTTTSMYSSTIDCQAADVVAPEPPPRSALNSVTMKPPPLPPKRILAPLTSNPPPRPPHSDYDYIENYQTTTSYSGLNNPPLPAPARKQSSNVVSKAPESDYYLQPFPLLPPPKKKIDSNKNNLPPKNGDASAPQHPPADCGPKKSLDITLSQLTKTGFSDLAAMLNMSPASLSKMTLQDLTKCLNSLSSDSEALSNISHDNKTPKSGVLSSECYSALRDSIEEDTTVFKAEFDAHFNSSIGPSKKEEESLFDKYAVFRELLEEEKNQNGSVFDDSNADNSEAASPCAFKEDDDEEDEDDGKASEDMKIPGSNTPPTEDRYAALRDICLDEVAEEKYDDLSDKEDSIIEPSRLDEDTDLLPQSRPHSESTESPTVTMKEHQSIIEATIMEEDISALDVDEEDVTEEAAADTLKDLAIDTCEPVIDQTPKGAATHAADQNRLNKISDKFHFSSMDKFHMAGELKSSEPSTTWAKFDNAPTAPTAVVADSVSIPPGSEGHVSPWSNESKDNDLSPACRDKRKHRKMRRHKTNQWQEDEESEEGWDSRGVERTWSPSSWNRENGWSDGDSLYGDTPPFMERDYPSPRRGRRRRMSPWNSREQSPWEEDDRDLSEDQWENPRWQDDIRQRLKHRGQSRDDERRSRHYDELRKSRKPPIPWSSDIDRKSSRESLAWEDDERYQNRGYIDRRRRKWDEDASHSRSRGSRVAEWSDQGMKLSNRYYKDSRDRHDPHWDSEYGDHGDDESARWARRPRSCDRGGRRPFSGSHHSAEADYQDRRSYMRSTRDGGHYADMDYRRKTQTLQTQKQRRKHSQTSPFEDDFSSQFFPKDSPNGVDAFDPESNKSSLHDSTKKLSFGGDIACAKLKGGDAQGEYSAGTPVQQGNTHSLDYTWESVAASSKVSRSYQQSPFEDDFAPTDARRCSGRSASSDMSDQKGSDGVFFGGPPSSKIAPMTTETSSLSRTPSSALRRPRSANPALSERCSRLCKNNNVESSQQSKNKIGQHFDAEVNEMKIAQTPPDAKLNSHATASAAVADAKARAVAGHLQRSDSSSSLRKSESDSSGGKIEKKKLVGNPGGRQIGSRTRICNENVLSVRRTPYAVSSKTHRRSGPISKNKKRAWLRVREHIRIIARNKSSETSNI
ncbi:unnamed protein product, partial [Nesidiocoris tenuis]